MKLLETFLLFGITFLRSSRAFCPTIPRTTSCTFVTPTSSTTIQAHQFKRGQALQSSVISSSTSNNIPRIPGSSLQELSSKGYVIIQDFLPPNLVEALREDVKTLRSSNKFNVAKIGQDSTNNLNTEIRVAETCFLGESKLLDMANNARQNMYDILDSLRVDLSGNELFDTNDSSGELVKAAPALDKSLSELLYAYYPKGGFYRRHTDAVSNSASVLRSYSLLLYLNNDWKESDGGCLRIHLDSGGDFLPDNEEPNYVDVEPRGGTLVLFKSDQIPHEVLDTNAERTAIVGWYNRPYTSADISSLASEEDKVRGMMLMVAAALVTVGTVSILTG